VLCSILEGLTWVHIILKSSQAEYDALEADPAIVHFTGSSEITPAQVLNPYVRASFKPWSFYCPHQPWRDHFFRWVPSESLIRITQVPLTPCP
jgi:hypothetical protein